MIGEVAEEVEVPASVRRQWSLSNTLAVLIFLLLASVLFMYAWATDRVVHDAAMDRAMSRLSIITRELASSAAQSSNAPQLQRLSGMARIQRALVGAGSGSAAAASGAQFDSILGSNRGSERTYLGRELWRADGTRLKGTGPLLPKDSLMLDAMLASALGSDSVRRSPLYEVNGEMHLWMVSPVAASREVDATTTAVQQAEQSEAGAPRLPSVGVLAELRRVNGTPEQESRIQRLTGAEASVYFTSIGSSEWASILGKPMAKPFELPAIDTLTHRLMDGAGNAHYVVQSQVAGTPWVIVVSQSEQSILARAHRFRGQLLFAALVALALGTMGAWLVSRRATRPLVVLRDAASEMARGNYDRRVPVRGGQEVASLAYIFNGMATRIGAATTELATQNAALHEANEAKTHFLAVMSHELRTPLNAINGYVELMNLGLYGPLTPEQHESMAKIARNSDQLLHLVSDILHYSKLDAGQLILRRETVRLNEQFAATAETLAEQFKARSVALVVTPTHAAVCADAARLQQVLLNLVTNAVRFTDAGGSVTIFAVVNGDKTSIHVADTGVGIPDDQLESIFRPFVQGDSSLTRKVGGTGLGLTIVRDLTQAMGGQVFARSAVGKGSEFTVVLDSAPQAKAPPITGSTEERLPGHAPPAAATR